MEQQTIPVAPALCRCTDVEPPGQVVRDVLMRRHDTRHGEPVPQLGGAIKRAELAVWSDAAEGALYYALLEVAVAAMAVMDRLDRPGA